jgi:hypothetical protein
MLAPIDEEACPMAVAFIQEFQIVKENLAPLIAKVFANDPTPTPPTREASYELYKTIP